MKGQRHEWRDRDDDGEVILCRGTWFGGEWSYAWRSKQDPEWTYEDPISLRSLRRLRERVWGKYQRNRVAYKKLEALDGLIEEAVKVEMEGEEVGAGNSEVGSDGDGELDEVADEVEPPPAAPDPVEEWAGVSVIDLGLGVRALNSLTHLEISTVGELLQWTRMELIKSRLFPKATLAEVEKALEERGVALAAKG